MGVLRPLVFTIFLSFFLWFSASAAIAATGTFKQINFQGKVVTKTTGTNIADGSYSFTFRLYDVDTAGTHIWTETKSLTVTNGIFQTYLGDTTSLPGSVDFNTDNIYLGINFNGDGEMAPRVRFSAVPQAMNALKVAGLTVTDTTGTLTIPNSTTITFSGANATTFTTTGSTNVTLPTTGTLSTLAGVEVLTNKSIGSTGLTFSGATTDITTATNENLTFTADGTGDIVFTTDAGTTFAISNLASCDTIDTDINGVLSCGTDSGGGGGGTLQQAYDGDADGSNATITLSSTDDSVIITNPTSSGSDSSFVVQFNQNNTTAAMTVADFVQLSNAANAVNVTANSIDTETGLALTANGLTSGKGLTVNSSSTAFNGGVLAEFALTGSNFINLGTVLKVANTGTDNANTSLLIDHYATGTNNLALKINDQSGDTTPFIVDGNGRVGIGTSSVTGSTERILQVGSGTNRGNAAIYGDVISAGLSQISLLSNIKDIYVYDTTADSDGGRWIDWATTDKLSWYTETLDDGPSDPCVVATDDRCYTTNFPRKAILVVTTDALYIFDASTNDMWMKFSQNASGYALGVDTNNDPSSVTAVNGVIYVGTNGSAPGGLYVIDFVNDRMWNIDGTDRAGADVGISHRNSAVTYASDATTALDLSVSGTAAEWEKINDVSAAVITGSTTAITIGAATNLSPGGGNTFIALATDSGLTVINLAAQKLVQYSDNTADDYTAVHLTRRGRMYALNTSTDQLERWNNFDSDKASEINGGYDGRWDESVGPALWTSIPNIIAGAPDALEVIERGSLAEENSDIIYVGHSLGLTEIHDHSTLTNGWSKFYNTTRQTMLMPASIDMALMLDETSGTLAQDVSFNDTDVSIIGSPTLGVSGVRGKAISLNGSSQYLCSDADKNATCDLDASFNMTTTGFTLSLWFKHSTSLSGVDTIFEKCVTAAFAQAIGCVTAYMTGTGTIVAAIDDDATWTRGSSYDITATSTLTYNDNLWHQLILSRTNANDMDVYIDGNPLNLSTATGLTTTVDGSQIVTFGGACGIGAGANCAAANVVNYWDGQLDDITYSNSTTTIAQMSAAQARRLYNDARPTVGKRVITVADATTVSSTTIGDSGEAWIPNEFSGMIVTLTEGTGVGQTRRVVSNTTTTLTVTPAFSPGPDTTTDFEIDPEALYGASNTVYAIGITSEAPLGEARQMCVGTNDSADGGGVTCYNHQAGPNIIADVFHTQAEQDDDAGNVWSGTNSDNIHTIDLSGRAMIIGTETHMYLETRDVRLGQGLDYLANQLFNIRSEIINDGIALTGSSALEVGFTGGADLAEYYTSESELDPGTVVRLDQSKVGAVAKAERAYQPDVLGIVATAPGLVLGPKEEQSYAVALVGRVPVKVISQSGPIKAGDRITASDVPGYAMRATKAGRVLGTALEDFTPANTAPCPISDALPGETCGVIEVFVNLSDYLGTPLDVILHEIHSDDPLVLNSQESGLAGNDFEVGSYSKSSLSSLQWDILSYLRSQKASTDQSINSAVSADRVVAYSDIISPQVITDLLVAKTIRADRIEGMEIFTNRLDTLSSLLAAQYTATNSATQVFSDSEIKTLNSLTILDFLKIGKGLEVIGNATFLGTTLFNGTANFTGDVTYLTAPLSASDSAGTAMIRSGASQVVVQFSKTYSAAPIVQASLISAPDSDESSENLLLSEDLGFLITRRNPSGFTIRLKKPAPFDILFGWTAMFAPTGKQSVGESPVVSPALPTTQPTSSPLPTQDPTSEPLQPSPSATPLVSEGEV
ncbi:hypothetical protein KBD71_01515 [Candidatus Woesebacteria bacterium]|nr:hypothetical protein [Candidatus Woesebacteria bacterium]